MRNVKVGYRLMLCRGFALGSCFFNNVSILSFLLSNFDLFCG